LHKVRNKIPIALNYRFYPLKIIEHKARDFQIHPIFVVLKLQG